MKGKVYLVGAGPGDPELITVRGRRLLGVADSILYDHLASPLLLREARPGTECVYVGKKRADHARSQEEIIEMLISRAEAGRTVLRLKGGDPFIFGRGGEEVEALAEAGIEYEVVPGVTSPLGIAACTGVPLTHREHTSVVSFVTGHDVAAIDWSKTGLADTLVIFMGLHHLPELAQAVMGAGRSADTPAMAVRWGTRPDQKTVSGTLADLPRLVEEAHLAPPATIFVGDVVRLREKLDWFERRPLFGQRVIITRSRDQSGELWQLLARAGADPVELPVIELAPADDYTALDGSLRSLGDYAWVIFTSTNAVSFFMARLNAHGLDARAFRGRICAIGTGTTEALREYGIRADLMGDIGGRQRGVQG
jgi:uroporphyrinogen III methyltransferase / synthase